MQEARKRTSKIQVKYPARLYTNDRLVKDEFSDWFDLMRESRIGSFDGVENSVNFSNIKVVISGKYINQNRITKILHICLKFNRPLIFVTLYSLQCKTEGHAV